MPHSLLYIYFSLAFGLCIPFDYSQMVLVSPTLFHLQCPHHPQNNQNPLPHVVYVVDREKLRAVLLINPTKSTLLPILNRGEVGPKTQGRPLVSGSTGN